MFARFEARSFGSVVLAAAVCAAVPCAAMDQRLRTPDATVDLMTESGVSLVRGAWRFHDAEIVETDFRAPGLNGKPTGAPNQTYDISPHAGAADFDDSSWQIIDPATLTSRRGGGKLSFAWYRLAVTVPERIGPFDPTGSTLIFEIVVDDYAEIWVNGALPRVLGQTGGSLVAGWNAVNRVLVAENVEPGQTFQLAVFAANGPISDPPANYIWIRSATLDLYSPERLTTARRAPVEIRRLDPRINDIISSDPILEKLADGFEFTEGPVWSPQGYLLFSDPNANTIYRWSQHDGVSIYRPKSGYAGFDIGPYRQPGSNGLAFDAEGRLTICEHGNRRITRIEPNGAVTVLADRYRGRRLNSPNDLVYRSDGALFFTDPPFGLPQFHDDPRRELDATGVYCLINGELKLLTADLSGPNGIALSPDEQYLYVANWDLSHKVVMRYDLHQDGSVSGGEVFFDLTAAAGEEALDGVKVDHQGNVYVSGPGGVWIVAPDTTPLGVIIAPELPANFAWGDADRRTLYLAARSGLYRLRLRPPRNAPRTKARKRATGLEPATFSLEG